MAVTHRSFAEYVKKRFDNNFWAAAESYLEANLDSLGVELRRIHRAGETEISDVKVEHVWVEDKPGMEIYFDVAVSIWFETHEGDYHYDDYDENIVWMMAHCRGDLGKNLDDFEILRVSKYNGKSRVKNPMDDSLVPVMNKNDLDEIAEQFLRTHYKKALLEPTWIDPIELANGMGLTVRYEHITKMGRFLVEAISVIVRLIYIIRRLMRYIRNLSLQGLFLLIRRRHFCQSWEVFITLSSMNVSIGISTKKPSLL